QDRIKVSQFGITNIRNYTTLTPDETKDVNDLYSVIEADETKSGYYIEVIYTKPSEIITSARSVGLKSWIPIYPEDILEIYLEEFLNNCQITGADEIKVKLSDLCKIVAKDIRDRDNNKDQKEFKEQKIVAFINLLGKEYK
ncbi:2934_t:CDS:2, partial [Gigaspora rosea]